MYYIGGQLGKGGFGVVKHAVCLRDGKVRAAKTILERELAKGEEKRAEALRQFKKEFEQMRDNPHVSPLRLMPLSDPDFSFLSKM